MGETLSFIQFLSMAIGFAGTLIILRPGFVELNLGAALLITGAVCMTVSSLC